MRRISRIAAVALMASMALTGCGSSGGDNGGNKTTDKGAVDACKGSKPGDGPKVGIAFDVGGIGDQSFNDSANAGVKKAIEELGASCVSVEPAAGGQDNDTKRAERLRTLADQGYNPIISIGFIYTTAVSEVAPDYKDTTFGVIDGYTVAGKAAGLPNDATPNMVDLTFAENEGSYLVGVAAALKSKSKHVGFVGGTHGDLIKKFEAGYVAGVKAVDPKIKVEVTYLTEDPTDVTTGFENRPGGKTAAEGQLDKGADVIYHAAGKSGLGVFDAVTEAGADKWAIGVDSDQYLTASAETKKHLLTSMIKRVDVAVYNTIKAQADGKPLSGPQVFDLKVDGVGYSKSGGFIDDIASKLDDYAAKIKAGEIKVPAKP